MIRIVTDGQDLVLNHSTTMTVELNNAIFVSPDVEGDISFTFTLPAEGNRRPLGFPDKPQCEAPHEVPCSVYCNGNFNWNGKLIIQKASKDTISVAIIINPYPGGYGKRQLEENEDTEIVISKSLSVHSVAWKKFLAASINKPDVKFAPFFNGEGYGSDNEDWGFWHGQSRRKVVNELFFDSSGNMIESESLPFSQAHNKTFDVSENGESGQEAQEYTSYTEKNQLAFCPQIRIARILEILCRNAGYYFINHLGEDLNSTFLQSQKSLDGTAAQFEQGNPVIRGDSGETTLPNNMGYPVRGVYMMPVDTYSEEHIIEGKTNLPVSGWWNFTVNLDCIVQREPGFWYADWEEYVRVSVCLVNGNRTYEELTTGEDVIQEWDFKLSEVKVSRKKGKCRAKMAMTQKLHLESENATGLRFYICAYHYNTKDIFNIVSYRMTMEAVEISADTEQSGFNIFRSRFSIPEILPDISNASLLKTMLETMGLCYFISGKTKRIEIVPYAMLHEAGSLDLTEYELTRETETETPEETLRTFRLKPMKDESYNENLRAPDVRGNHLPDAYSNHERLVLLTKTNTLYRAAVQEHEDLNWVEGWEEHSGNPDRLEVGGGEEENREPSVSIPHQRFVGGGRVHPETDTATGETPQLMVADFTISSDIYNISEKPSDLILTQYRGLRKRAYISTATDGYVWNAVMLPVWNNEFSLTAKGENSLGEKYIKPVLELLGHKTITYKLRLPANMMQQVENLLRPSELPPERQTRFIVIRNVKTVPKKITFQIDNSIDDTVLCQIEAVKVY